MFLRSFCASVEQLSPKGSVQLQALGAQIHVEGAFGKSGLHGGGCGLWDGR
jgi:hypothetical protein